MRERIDLERTTLVLDQPAGTFALTPASRVGIEGILAASEDLAGIGFDWGCGVGTLGLAAASIPKVTAVLGFDINGPNVEAANKNAALNGLADKASFFVADSYDAVCDEGRAALSAVRGRVDFVVANPPSSGEGTDGFEYRRAVVQGARDILRPGGQILLNVSRQYGMTRIQGLAPEGGPFVYQGVVASTPWVPFDLGRPDLLEAIKDYATEESRGGIPYAFYFREDVDRPDVFRGRAALDALAEYERAGGSPLTQWQVHRFRRV